MRAIFRSIQPLLLVGAVLAMPLGLSACGSANGDDAEVAKLDQKLTGKGSDPAMNTALDDKILVDPDLTDSANVNTVKPADTPLNGQLPSADDAAVLASAEELDSAAIMQAPKPTVAGPEDCANCGANKGVTLGALADEQGVKRGKGTCDAKLQYGAGFANRMPTEFPVYPRGAVREAGGVEGGLCDIRVVSFTSNAKMQDIVNYYYTRARRSGFSAEYQIRRGEHVLGGTRDHDGGAYFITFNPGPGGCTIVEIVANNGR